MIDFSIVLAYLAITLVIGYLYGRKIHTLKDFAISNKGFSSAVLLATLFATVIGGGSTCGIATNVHKHGIIFMFAFCGAALNKILVAKYVAPKFSNFREVLSIGDIFHEKYGLFGRILSGFFIFYVSVTCIGQQVTAIAFIFQSFFEISFIQGALLGYGVLVLYSSFGGIRSVVSTDVLQFILMLAFIPVVLVVSLQQIGGLEGLIQHLPESRVSLDSQLVHWQRAMTMFFIMTFSALDPSFIHRLIMAKDAKEAVYITKVTGYLSFPFFTVMGLIGLISYIRFPGLNSGIALPHLIQATFPVVLKGFAITGILATLMSTADSALHVLGLSVVRDLILPFRKIPLSDKNQVLLARLITALMGFLSLLICLFIKDIFFIMIVAFSFWGPTVLVPFIFILYQYVFTRPQLSLGVLLGGSTVIMWNKFLQPLYTMDGFLPGLVVSVMYFTTLTFLRNKDPRYVLQIPSKA